MVTWSTASAVRIILLIENVNMLQIIIFFLEEINNNSEHCLC